jgi:hypothetical protein
MKWLALFLILAALGVFMLRPPGLYDSKARRDASRRYFKDPNEMTRMALEEVKRAEGIEILVCLISSVVLLGTGIFVMIRSQNETHKRATSGGI